VLPVAIAAVAIAASTATLTLAATLGHVRQQSQLTRTLHSARHLALVPTARARDPAGPDLPAVGDEPPQCRDVLVVNLLDMIAAVRARLAPTRSRAALPVAPANRPSTLLRHLASPIE